ncbi:MAG: hypothetical protein OEW48_00580 [Phycisphaerae bacterium]|nr:hypothetical protein [Phycisphaerae bacterium]
MFKNEDDFKTIVNLLNIDDKPNPTHRESLRGQMLSVFNENQERTQTGTRPLWMTIMKSPIGKLAAAAVIIIAVLVGIHQLGNSVDVTTVALANVVENINKKPWMHATVKRYQNGKENIHQQWCHFSSEKAFGKGQDGAVWCFDYGTGQKQFFYQPSTNTLEVNKLSEGGFYGTDSAYNLINAAVQYQAEENATISEYLDKLNGRKVKVFQIEKTMPVDVMSIGPKVVVKTKYYLLADIKTKLMIAVRAEYLNKDDRVIRYIKTEVTYPETGPKDIYALGVPRTAKIIDTSEVIAAEAKNEPELIATPKPTAGPEMAPLPIKLPRPMFVGTPQDIKVARLEKPLGKPRPPFFAPVGTKNVAFGKRVASTDEEPIIGEIEMITDGDKEGSDGSYVELGPFKQHVTIDLGAEYNIYAIVVWHFHKNPIVYFDVVVQISSEPNFVKPKTVFNNDIDNSLKFGVGKNMHYVETSEGKLIDAKGTPGRYVRLYSQGSTQNDLNHYIEVEVYGKDAKEEPKQTPDEKKERKSDDGGVKKADPNIPKTGMVPLQIKLPKPMFVGTPLDNKVSYLEKPLGKPRPPFYAPVGTKNVAFEKPVTSTDEEPIIGEIELITDGDKEGSDGSFVELGPSPQSITIDLEAVHEIYAIVVWHYHKEAWIYFDVAVQVADDPDFITNVRTLFNNDIDNSLGLGVGKNMHYVETSEGKLIDAKGVRARYLRLHSNGSNGSEANHYIEVEVYGKAVK